MKTAVDAVFVGKERQFNRRFAQLMSHHLVEPTACTPAAGWEKGQVENQVGVVRRRFFSPRLKFKSYEELNALARRPVRRAGAKTQPHPEQKERTVFEMFEDERPVLMPYRGPFDGFHATTAVGVEDLPRAVRQQQVLGRRRRPSAARSTCMPMPTASSSSRTASSSASIGAASARDQIVYDPWHYVPVLARKPGALRNGAPFKDWPLPGAIEKVRRKLAGSDDGDRQMVKILTAVLTDGFRLSRRHARNRSTPASPAPT